VTDRSTGATGTPQPAIDRALGAFAGSVKAAELDDETTESRPAASDVDATRFAHASETEMARILDFYDVRWEYEPTTFPILWNLDGEVVESFAPDFYLPELDLFLEMTTLKQRLVRKKNRKLRRLRELYPDVRIKLFYARDFRAMMLKYGRFALAESLSGTPGQVVPERAAVEVPTPDKPAIVEPVAEELPKVLVQPAPLRVVRRRASRPRNGRRVRTHVAKPGAAEREADE
jgi:hypothetical protein